MQFLILDDETVDAEAVCRALMPMGARCTVVRHFSEALTAIQSDRYQLAIIDHWLNDSDRRTGTDLICQVRSEGQNSLPVIVVSATVDPEQISRSLDVGADDYITKPINDSVLRARVSALLRRTSKDATTTLNRPFRVGHVLCDYSNQRVEVNGVAVPITPLELAIAESLLRNAGSIISRKVLQATHDWQSAQAEGSRSVDVHVARLRRKLLLSGEFDYRLVAVYGRGYRVERSAVLEHG
jgi:DNA-binding response OmpR family regulator